MQAQLHTDKKEIERRKQALTNAGTTNLEADKTAIVVAVQLEDFVPSLEPRFKMHCFNMHLRPSSNNVSSHRNQAMEERRVNGET